MAVDDGNGAARAGILAAVRDAAAACLRYQYTLHRTFVARDGQNLDDILVVRIAAQRQLYAILQNGALLVNAAAHRGYAAVRNQLGRNVHDVLRRQRVFIGQTCHLGQYAIL